MSIDKELNKNAVRLTAEDLEKLSGGNKSGIDDRRIRSALQSRGKRYRPIGDWSTDDDPDNAGSL